MNRNLIAGIIGGIGIIGMITSWGADVTIEYRIARFVNVTLFIIAIFLIRTKKKPKDQ